MAETIVKVPSTANYDFDFLAFSFGGKHSYDDFGIYRTLDGDRYNIDLAPTLMDMTADVPSSDGMYFFNTLHKQKDFNVSFAFDDLSEEKMQEMKKWLDGKDLKPLWFEEAPYKVYTAKVTGQPQLKVVCFTKMANGEKKRVYKGEGTLVFTAYWPYGHTPDKIDQDYFKLTKDINYNSFEPIRGQYFYIKSPDVTNASLVLYYNSGTSSEPVPIVNGVGIVTFDNEVLINSMTAQANGRYYIYKTDASNTESSRELKPCLQNGRLLNSYNEFYDKTQWGNVLLASGTPSQGENAGELPAYFVFSKSDDTNKNTVIAVGDLIITLKQDVHNLQWDSKTGIVSGTSSESSTSTRKPVAHIGNTLGSIPVGGVKGKWGVRTIDENGAYQYSITNCSLNYHYWYY